jgi:predicted kinase
VLFIFGGLPGTGKTELSTYLAQKIGATLLRIDTIEQAIRDSGLMLTGPEGYIIAYRIAADNLKLGLPVVADSVNPLDITRQAWREVATQVGAPFREIEVICSDKTQHRRRVETRKIGIPSLKPPTWQEVVEREYHLWEEAHIVIDTAGQTPEESKRTLGRILGI